MQIINNIDQGSEAWLQLRLGKPTASNFNKIVTSTGKRSESLRKYALELASEMLVTEMDDIYKSPEMERGNELEPMAREHYQCHTFNRIEEVGFIDCGDFGYSPDGFINDDGLLEIKCPNKITHTKYLYDDKIPATYVQQCQGGLLASGRRYLDFVSFHPNFKEDKELFIKRVERDEDFINKLIEGIKEVIKLRDEFIKKIRGK